MRQCAVGIPLARILRAKLGFGALLVGIGPVEYLFLDELARGERLVLTLNQNERAPLSVEDQVVQVYAATNGYLDRILVSKVEEFLIGLTQRVRAEDKELLATIAGGDWSKETQETLDKVVGTYADDFGYDLDEEGQPVDSGDSERVTHAGADAATKTDDTETASA